MRGTPGAAVTERGVLRRFVCAANTSPGERPDRVLTITKREQKPDGVVSDFKRVRCRRDQRDVARGNDDNRQTNR